MDDIKLCDCIAGGQCLSRGADVRHDVVVWWKRQDDDRSEATIASPVALDDWMLAGEIVGAYCPTCPDSVDACPAFAPYLLANGWEMATYGRDALRDIIQNTYRSRTKEGLREARSALLYLLHTYRPDSAKPGMLEEPVDLSLTRQVHQLWINGTIRLTDVRYWLRVLARQLS